MPAELVCPYCGCALEAAGDRCPGCGLGAEDLVASWVSGPDGPSAEDGDDRSCRACGYVGEPGLQGDLEICPACQVALPKAPDPAVPAVRRVVLCPGCDLAIGITDADRDRTVVCSRCQYFLGCLLKGERRRASWLSLGISGTRAQAARLPRAGDPGGGRPGPR